jgi:hypothetical protein
MAKKGNAIVAYISGNFWFSHHKKKIFIALRFKKNCFEISKT